MGALCAVSPPRKSLPKLPTNNTVKLSEALRSRVAGSMEVLGFTVWAEFCRVALTEKCHATEQALLTRDPAQHARVYGRPRA